MAAALHDSNMLTCLHKYYPLEDLIGFFTRRPGTQFHILHARHRDRFDKFSVRREVRRLGEASLICVDAANGYTKFFVDR